MTETWDRATLVAFVREQWEDEAPPVIALIDRWLARGDGAAVYRNHDLGHPHVGEPRIVSYGSPAAQLETDEPPTRLPDNIPKGAINWRFQLEATCRTGGETDEQVCD
jgi:hypothetical protein